MSMAALGFISKRMEELKIPYMLMEWTGQPPDPYFVGEYTEVESQTREENGFQETSFLLTGFTKKSWTKLEKLKEKIERNITQTAIMDDGSVVAVFYLNAFPVRTGDADLKKLQINLQIKEWRN